MMTAATRRTALIALLAAIGFHGVPLPAQGSDPLYTPRAIRMTYQKGTRSLDGRPGPNYWQNHGRYRITLTATPPDRMIRGAEQITYINHSPDTLRTLAIKLLLNEHKPGAPRHGGANPAYLGPGIIIDRFAVNGAAQPWSEAPTTFTTATVRLPVPLNPADSVQLTFDWHYQLATVSNREGATDSTAFFLAYFYPRVAVYDDYNGWDMINFTGSQEFYSDFNDYDVTVRVPRNVTVWGTGTLTNPGEVLQEPALGRYRASFTADSTVHVATPAEMAARQVTRQDSVLSWHFTATNVPDVTFALSDHWAWDAGSTVVDAVTGRRASVQAAYPDSASDYHVMVRLAGEGLSWLSSHWPGVPYPYEKTTIVLGFADMEYPMMVNDGNFRDTTFARFVAAHELAHTWFPFYMGINESRYAFMDEGWATTFEYLINQADMGPARAAELFKQFRVNGWIHDPSPLEDLPIITPEDMLAGSAYGNNAYGKPALGYLALKDYLGDSMFRRVLHGFIDRWHGKHPIPWDFFYTVNNLSGRNLNWFWKSWFFDNSYIDLGVTGVTRTARGQTIQLVNVGGMPAPFDLQLTFTDGTTRTLHQTAGVWAANLSRATVTVPGGKTIRSVRIDGGIWVDADMTNNSWKAR